MRRNSETLEQYGVFVPKAGTLNEESGHHRLAWEMRGDERNTGQKHYVDDLLKELNSCHFQKALISSEDFEYLSAVPDELILLQKKTKSMGWQTEFLAYVRKPVDYAVSLYRELLKHDQNVTIIDYLRQIRKTFSYTTRSGWFFDFDSGRLVRTWEEFFKTPLRVVSYDEVILHGGILPPLLDILGINGATNFSHPINRENVTSLGSRKIDGKLEDFLIKAVVRHQRASR